MPVIHARESIDAANRHAMGAGTLDQAVSYRMGAAWDEAAQLRREPAGAASDADLMAMGVDPRRRRKRAKA